MGWKVKGGERISRYVDFSSSHRGNNPRVKGIYYSDISETYANLGGRGRERERDELSVGRKKEKMVGRKKEGKDEFQNLKKLP